MAVTLSAGNRWQGSDLVIADSKTFTMSAWFKQTSLASQVLVNWHRAGQSTSHGLSLQSDGDIAISGRNAAGTTILASAAASQPITAATWHHVLIAVNLAAAEPERFIVVDASLAVDAVVTAVVSELGLVP